jgi:O-acetyl-ADP-ribose deacetylase (regulator of RNase III)
VQIPANIEIATDVDIFDFAPESWIVNPINCKGVMGVGLALAFKKRYPGYFMDYRTKCSSGKIRPGKVDLYTWRGGGVGEQPTEIVSFPTKNHWSELSRLEDIETGLLDLSVRMYNMGCKSIAIPALGCGLGGLSWDDVLPVMIWILEDNTNTAIYLIEPQ